MHSNARAFIDQHLPDFHKRVLDISSVGILITDRDGYVTYLNPAFAMMYNLKSPQSVIGRKVDTLFSSSRMIDVMKTGIPDKARRCPLDGRDALVNRYPIIVDGETVGGLVEVFFRDISVMKDILERMSVLEKKVHYYKQKSSGLPRARHTFDDLIGTSKSITELKKMAERFAHSSRPVLIQGESGTGKEILAHSVHSASPRASEAFISVNCAAIPKDLLESELFGFEEGTFSGARSGGRVGKFEIADKGTIFLDEIGELPLDMQAKLLRVIENGEIQKIGSSAYVTSDFRLIAATNKDLSEAVAARTFREDLYHRLNMLVLKLPPLRDREDDALMIAKACLEDLCDVARGRAISFSHEVTRIFRAYPWPGNIRELKNTLCSAMYCLDENQTEITLRNLPPYLVEKCLTHATTPENGNGNGNGATTLNVAREKGEKDALLRALELTGNNKVKAAQMLSISRNELYKKLKKYGLSQEAC